MIENMLMEYKLSDDNIQGIYMSGMLTSDLGILEVPHLTAPVSMKNYQEHLVHVYLPEVFSKEIILIMSLLILCVNLILCEAKRQRLML